MENVRNGGIAVLPSPIVGANGSTADVTEVVDDTLDRELQGLNSPNNSEPEGNNEAEVGDEELDSNGAPEGGDVEMRDVSGGAEEDVLDGVDQLFQED